MKNLIYIGIGVIGTYLFMNHKNKKSKEKIRYLKRENIDFKNSINKDEK